MAAHLFSWYRVNYFRAGSSYLLLPALMDHLFLHQVTKGRYDVLVITAGALLANKSLTLDLFHTVVFDEVHHATGSHDFARILTQVS